MNGIVAPPSISSIALLTCQSATLMAIAICEVIEVKIIYVFGKYGYKGNGK